MDQQPASGSRTAPGASPEGLPPPGPPPAGASGGEGRRKPQKPEQQLAFCGLLQLSAPLH
eukprot:13092525-Alexandrium_andersonii.AAC.1